MQEVISQSEHNPPRKKKRKRISRQSRSNITSSLRKTSEPLTEEQKLLAERYIPLANATTRKVVDRLRESGYAADEDSIKSDINYELILLAGKVDPYKRLDGLF